MKKLLIATALALTAVSSSFAQGYVLFNNGTTTKISTNSVVNGAATGTTTAGDSLYYYALFYSTSQTAVNSGNTGTVGTNGAYVFNTANWTSGGDIGTNSISSTGRFLSQQADSLNNSGASAVASSSAGGAYQFVVIGWSGNIGSTLASVETWYNNGSPFAGYIGESVVSGTITTGSGGPTTPPGIFGTSAGLIPGFTLGLVTPVPEPGTMALAALSGASLLLFRRRK
jgi:hypothetical protein